MESKPAFWPLPDACKLTVQQLLEKLERDRVRRAKKKTPSKEPKQRDAVEDFISNQFRKKFYQIISHHCVMTLRSNAKKPNTENGYTNSTFAKVLGIDHTQVKRWNRELTFIEADSFFAFLILIERGFDTLFNLIQRSDKKRPILNHESIVEATTYSMLRFLVRKYGNDSEASKQMIREDLILLFALMTRMRNDAGAVYLPSDKDSKKDEALTRLADALLTERRHQVGSLKQEELEQMKQRIKPLLEYWTIAYSLFAVGYQPKWPQMEGLK